MSAAASASDSLASLLAPARVLVGLEAENKEVLIEALIERLRDADSVTDLDRVRADVFAREALMSTGVGNGLALPHARSSGVTETVAAIAITARPVEYAALDGEPVCIGFLLVGPEGERGAHVRLLGRLSRLMASDAFRARLLAASDAASVLAAFDDLEPELT